MNIDRSDPNRDFFLNLDRNIIETDDGYCLQKVYEEDDNVFIYTSKEMNVEYDMIIADSIEDAKNQIEEILVEHWNDEISYLENRISSFQGNDD